MKKFLCTTLIFLMSTSSISVFAQDGIETRENNNKNIVEEISPRAQYGRITENNVHFRKDPGLSSVILGQLHAGYTFTYDQTRPNVKKDGYTWVSINYNGTYGWVSSQYISMIG